MAVDVITEIVIDRPCSVVADYAADPSNVPQWYENIKSVQWKTQPPLSIGTEVAFVAQFLGRTMAYTYKVIEFISGKRLVMSTAEGPFPMETTYTWESLNQNRTKMTLRNRGEPRGFSKFIAPLMTMAVRNANRKDLARLKALLEQT